MIELKGKVTSISAKKDGIKATFELFSGGRIEELLALMEEEVIIELESTQTTLDV